MRHPTKPRAAHLAHPTAAVRGVRRALLLALTLVTLSILARANEAFAANEEDAFVNNDSLLLGGAARTTIADGGAVWLNPSRLAQIQRRNVNANISAARFTSERIHDAITLDGGHAKTLHLQSLALLPSSISTAISIDDRLTLGFGMFVSRTAAASQNIVLEMEDDVRTFRHVTSLSTREQDYNLVSAIGWQATERSQYGASLIIRYSREVSSLAAWNLLDMANYQSTFATTRSLQLTRLGVGLMLGGTWQVRRNLAVSAVAQSPMLMLIDVENSTTVRNETVINGENSRSETIIERSNELKADARAMGSIRLHTGVAWTTGPRTLSAELELRLEPDVGSSGYEAVWNARLGLMRDLDKGWTVGGGIFSDVTQKLKLDNVYDNAAQYGGVSFGARNRRVIQLGDGERARTIKRSSFIGARYMIGVGRFTGANIHINEGTSTPRNVPYVAHELSIYIGASMAF